VNWCFENGDQIPHFLDSFLRRSNRSIRLPLRAARSIPV